MALKGLDLPSPTHPTVAELDWTTQAVGQQHTSPSELVIKDPEVLAVIF